jgi:hypothetical protein
MTQPAPQTAPAATRNPTAMILGVVGALLVILGGFLFNWLSSGAIGFKGTDAPISLLWSSSDSAVEVSFASSAGLIVIAIGVIALIGALIARTGLLVIGGVLGVLAYALVAINLIRIDALDIGIGDFGLGLWAILIGGILPIVAGLMSRRNANQAS